MGTPHKHAELIKAWADGAQIQIRVKNAPSTHAWVNDNQPTWTDDFEYRIRSEKKKPVVRYLWADEHGQVSQFMYHEPFSNHTIKLEWSRTEFPE